MTMKKHPSAFKLCGELVEKVKAVTDTPVTLYEGILLCLCSIVLFKISEKNTKLASKILVIY